jgi:protein-S-isoprenylcysteine O-methyltransferase Ste14
MRIPPPLIALAAAAGQRPLTKHASPPGTTRRTSAAVIAASSLGLLAAASQRFRARGTTVDPLRPERASALVSSGPFAVTRNPMYVGMAGLLGAHAVLRGSPRALLPMAAFVAVIDRVQIPPEEAAMSSLFGAEYEAYRGRVPRWVGRG